MYDCSWGTDTVRVVVASELPREPHNAPLHLFSASPDLVGFGGSTYRRRSEDTSRLLVQLFERLGGEVWAMAYTMADFRRDFTREHFLKLTPQEQQDFLQSLPVEARLASVPPEARLAGLSPEQIRQYLDKTTASHKPQGASHAGRRKRRRSRQCAGGVGAPVPKVRPNAARRCAQRSATASGFTRFTLGGRSLGQSVLLTVVTARPEVTTPKAISSPRPSATRSDRITPRSTRTRRRGHSCRVDRPNRPLLDARRGKSQE